ncbi:hypothetical protein [Pontiella sulfatireligans]|uniref:Uncharacterized protein n=1 Tax=Pontiella sulfatireligans TaxID=2750658 RepID=A0A6C2URE9_9BACT|nr:hypothetical protein [Pontiella sulfatireligans]VGO22523.1 hypothetical protein SCARR_04607 [Pontiella sulfatireligans]
MSLVMHIFKKDLLRLRVFLCFWIPVAIIAGIASSVRAPADDFAMQTVLRVAMALSAVCQFIMMALMVPLLMHSEPLTGTTAFWLTRPLKKSDVLKSKLLFTGIFFLAVPLLIHATLLAAHQVPFTYILPSLLEKTMGYTGALLLLMAISAMTRNFGFFALTGVVYLVVAIIVGIVTSLSQQFQLLENTAPGMAITDTRTLLSSLAGIAMLSGIVWIQYRYRRTRWCYYLLALEFLATFWLGSFCNAAWFKKPPGTLSKAEAEQVEVLLGKKNSHISDHFSMRRRKVKYKEMSGDFKFEQLPENGFAVVSRVDAELEAEGRKAGEETAGTRHFSRIVDKEALRSVIEPMQLLDDGSTTYYSDRLLKVKESDYLAMKGKTGHYTADVTANIFRYKKAVALSLAQGEEFKDGPMRIAIASLLKETKGCTVIIRRQDLNPLFKRDRRPRGGDRFTFLLANPATGEAYLPEDDNGPSITISSSSNFSSFNKFLRFSSIDKPGDIDDAWLENAQLLAVETEWLGEIEKQVEDSRFKLGSSSSYISSIPDTSAKDNADKLAEVQLPDNATREEMKVYIQKIHNISATQSSYSPRDPQTAMLMEVGAENLGLLLENGGEWNSHYELYAVKKLARAEHKDLILKYLAEQKDLAEVVVEFGWESEARETLLEGLKAEEYLPGEWIKAVASFKDPATYPLLTGFLVNGRNRDSTYGIIKELPGIELEEPVAKAWRQAKYEQNWERIDMIPIATAYGHADALGAAAIMLNDDELQGYQRKELRNAFKKHTGIRGADEELLNWYKANKAALRFNPETKMFVAEGGAVTPEPTDRKEALLREVRLLLGENDLDLEIAGAELSEKGGLILRFEGSDQLAEGATATFKAPAMEDLEDAVRKMSSVFRISEKQGKRVKSIILTGGKKVPATYE